MTEETLLKFPTDFPVKIMGKSEQGFAEAMVAIIQQHAPDFNPATLEMRPSKNGNYLGLTATITATSKTQLDDLYRALSSHPLVKFAL